MVFQPCVLQSSEDSKLARLDVGALDDAQRAVLLQSEIENLRSERNWYCASFLSNQCSVSDVCIALDLIGKKSVDYYLMATVYQNCKSNPMKFEPCSFRCLRRAI